MHANGASFFFLFIYVHMLRGLFFSSYQYPRTNVWFTGVTIYLCLMGTAFLGYVLP
jgi:ubiquinol-cytochrome c reductase cytochrome b subunit